LWIEELDTVPPDNTAGRIDDIQQRMRIVQKVRHVSPGEETYPSTDYRDRTATAPLATPTDCGARSLAYGLISRALLLD
jgi:hypothetical protein